MRLLTNMPVDHGILFVALTVAAVAAVAVLVGRGVRRWLAWTALVAAAVVVVVALGTAVGIEHRVGSSFPRSFFLWGALPLGTLAFGVWRSGSRRATAVAVSLLVVLGAGQVNAHYAYLPTVGDVLGQPLGDQVAAATVDSIVAGRAAAPPGQAAGTSAGVLLPLRLPADVSGFDPRPGYVWVPNVWFRRPRPALPVVVMLAGVPGDPSNLLRAGHADEVAERVALAHDGLAPILVFPDHNGGTWQDSECVDGPRGNAETYLTFDVPAYVARTFGTARGGATWGIEGYSEGGTCAAMLSLRHPDVYGAFVDIAGDTRPNAGDDSHTVARLYGGSWQRWAAHDPARLLWARPAVDATFVSGSGDRHARAAAEELDAAADAAGVRSRRLTVAGGHSFTMASRAIAATLPALSDRLLVAAGLVPPSPQ